MFGGRETKSWTFPRVEELEEEDIVAERQDVRLAADESADDVAVRARVLPGAGVDTELGGLHTERPKRAISVNLRAG